MGRKRSKKFRRNRPGITQDLLTKADLVFAMGGSIIEACAFSGIKRATLYAYMKKHPDYKEHIKLLQAKPLLKARMNIANAINRGDEKMSRWYMERKCKREFGYAASKTEVNQTVTGTEVVPAVINMGDLVAQVEKMVGDESTVTELGTA